MHSSRGAMLAAVLSLFCCAHGAHADERAFAPAGLWNATLAIGGFEVPFRFKIAGDERHPVGWFFNGTATVESTGGEYKDKRLVLEFAQYARRLDVTLSDPGHWAGTYGPLSQATLPVRAERKAAAGPSTPAGTQDRAPPIAGLWIVPAASTKAGEAAFRLIVREDRQKISAAILRVDGDTGELSGTWSSGKAVLSHFSGARPALVELSANGKDTLTVIVHDLHGGTDSTLTAYRPADLDAKGLPAPADALHHTAWRDPDERFTFRFPDLDGHSVSSTDARFSNRVLIVDVSGSWCPNCHDEAPYLEALYRKYRGQGLEVVSLSFEEPEQLASLSRLRAFIQRYALTYTVLVGGTPAQAREKIPQAVDLDSWPTTFFIGRDGRVRSVHTGFAAPATGEFNVELRKSFEAEIEKLLAESARS